MKLPSSSYKSFTYFISLFNQLLNNNCLPLTVKYVLFQIICCKTTSVFNLHNGKTVLQSLNTQNTFSKIQEASEQF